MPEMEVARAFDLLLRVNREARGTPMGVPNFSKELARFVDRQVQKFPKLRDEVERENAERPREL